VWVEADDINSDENFSVTRNAGETITFTAELNQTSSAADATYDIYSVIIDREAVLLFSSMNVAATIDGQTVRDWTTFGAGQGWVDQC
jgi:hypothetical protein